jgi:hypothetical protein
MQFSLTFALLQRLTSADCILWGYNRHAPWYVNVINHDALAWCLAI